MTTEAKVGAFTLLGIVLFAAVAFFVSGISFGGDRGYTLYAGFRQVMGVTPESPVRLSGVPVGRVKDIANDGAGVTVTLKIDDGTKIPRGSTVAILADGVMGDKYINITPAKDRGDYLKDGDYLIGTDESSMDDMFATAAKMMEKAEKILDSIHAVTGNPGFQKDFLLMAANMRDTTAHLNGLLAALEQTMVQNQGQVTASLSNLNAAMASLSRTMDSTEAMMANLASVGADPQTAENLRLTLENVKEASERLAHLAENMDNSLGDPETGRELKETIANAHDITNRAKAGLDKISTIEMTPRADILYSGGESEWKANFNVDVGNADGAFLRIGADDIGADSGFNAQVGKRRGAIGGRAGLIKGDLGVGADFYAGDRFRFSADYYDFNDGKLRMQAAYRLGGSDTWLMGQMDEVNRSENRATYFGISQSF